MVHPVKSNLLVESNPQHVEREEVAAVNEPKPSKGKAKRPLYPSQSKERRSAARKNPSQVPASVGRPLKPLAEATANAITAWLHQGFSLRRLCEQPGMPKPATVAEWVRKDPQFASRFALARDGGADSLVDEAQDLADALTRDGRQPTSEEVQATKLQCEMRWKRAACFRPAKYGQKAMLEHAGNMSIQVVTGVPSRRPSTPILAEPAQAPTSPVAALSAEGQPTSIPQAIRDAGAAYATRLAEDAESSDGDTA